MYQNNSDHVKNLDVDKSSGRRPARNDILVKKIHNLIHDLEKCQLLWL